MAAYVAPLCYVAMGVGFLMFLAVNLLSSRVVRAWPGRWFGMGMLVAPVGFLMMAKAVEGQTVEETSRFLVAALAVFFIYAGLVGVGLIATARNQRSQGASS